MGALTEFAFAVDPALIMESAGMVPDPWQVRILRRRAPRELLNCGRQLGKSQTVAAAAVDEILRGPARILAICPAERQSKLLINGVKEIYQRIIGEPKETSTTHLEFSNGANMWALPSNEANIRGFSAISLLIVDEAARVPDKLYHAVRPMLAVSNGRLLCLSTPYGKRGFFFTEWMEGGDSWQRTIVRADQCARISPEFLAEEKRALPDSWYRQEYCCEFAETDGAVFAYDDVMRAMSDDVRPLFEIPESNVSAEVEPLFQ